MSENEKINKLGPLHEGTQPIRVLIHNLTYSFENTNPEFIHSVMEAMKKNGLKVGIGYIIDDEQVKIPFVNSDKKIFIQETFLSYVWCISYALIVFYDEALAKTSRNRHAKKEVEKVNKVNIQNAEELWNYGRSLIGSFSPWNKNLPNPESYFPDDKFWVEKINGVYLVAMKYILCHEFAHVEQEHFEKIANNNTNEQRKIFEAEADARAIDLVLLGVNDEEETTIHMGLLVGLCCLLFFRGIVNSETYPTIDNRIDAIFKKLQPEKNDPMWGVAIMAYKLWDDQWNKNIRWDSELDSFKDLYLHIKKQIEADHK